MASLSASRTVTSFGPLGVAYRLLVIAVWNAGAIEREQDRDAKAEEVRVRDRSCEVGLRSLEKAIVGAISPDHATSIITEAARIIRGAELRFLR